MAVKFTKPEINVREKLAELDKPSGIAGEAMLRAETPQEQQALIGVGRRNLLINGDFRVAQRATTYTKTANSWNVYGSVDRWGIYYQNTVVAQNSGVINGSYQYYVSVGNTGAAPDNHFIYQKIESGSRIVSGKPITISFMAKSANSTELRLRGRFMDSATASGSVNSGEKTFNLTPKWQSFDWTFTPVDTSANLTRDFLIIVDTEITNDTVSDIYDLTNFQLELGKVATPFEHRSYGEELALCQRYCYVMGTPSVSTNDLFSVGTGNGTGTATTYHLHPVEMRARPTLTYSALADFAVYNFGTSSQLGAPTAINFITSIGTKTWSYIDYTRSGTTTGNAIMIRAANTSTKLIFSAEL
jgi:hypothetical protein